MRGGKASARNRVEGRRIRGLACEIGEGRRKRANEKRKRRKKKKRKRKEKNFST